jgi:hypothetical protein
MSELVQKLETVVREQDLGELVIGIEQAVARSVHKLPQRDGGVTGDELKRRAQWCVDTALELLREHGWSIERVVDEMPEALVCYLVRGSWDPSKHRSWIQNGAEL